MPSWIVGSLSLLPAGAVRRPVCIRLDLLKAADRDDDGALIFAQNSDARADQNESHKQKSRVRSSSQEPENDMTLRRSGGGK